MQKTRDEVIMRLFGSLNAMTRRGPKPPPPPPHLMEGNPPHERLPGHGAGRLLGYLNDNGEMNQAGLAAALDIRPQSLSELTVKLETDGFVTRRQSPSDKRQTLVAITEQGKARVADFRERHRAEAEQFLRALTEEEKDTLYALLTKLVESHKDSDENL